MPEAGEPGLGQLVATGLGGTPVLHLVDPRNLGSQFLGRVGRVPGSGEKGARVGRRIWGTGWVLGQTGYLAGIRKILELIRDQLGIRQKAGGSWNERWGGGLRMWRRLGESQDLLGFGKGLGETQTSRESCGIGGVQGRAGSGSPVSCRKSTRVIPQVRTVCPVRTRTPGLSSAHGAIASARGPTRKKRSEGRALRGRGPTTTRGLEEAGCGRGRIG